MPTELAAAGGNWRPAARNRLKYQSSAFGMQPALPDVSQATTSREEQEMKKKSTAVIGMVAVCFMMMATMAWALPGVPNGTVTDGNLVWLQNANCFGGQNWSQAMSSAASLKSGSCGLTDGSTAGQWRLPTKEELQSRLRNQSGFNNVQAGYYWSSRSYTGYADGAGNFGMYGGGVYDVNKNHNFYVWPVRAGQ
jgi:hypothetical protein